MYFTNAAVAKLLRKVSGAYRLKGANRFQVAAYESAASAIEHATSEVKDLWEQGSLNSLSGIGVQLTKYLDELFKKGRVAHFEKVCEGIPDAFFPMLEIPGVGPKTAIKLVENGVSSILDLREKLNNGALRSSGWSEKKLNQIEQGLTTLNRREHRMLLPYADEIALHVLKYLREIPEVVEARALGSLRREVATIGDIDLAVSTNDPLRVIQYFVKTPGKVAIIERGEQGATIELASGIRVDLLTATPQHFASTLQHLTGSKQHNIHLRTVAGEKGYSLSEHGAKDIKLGKTITFTSERELYKLLNMDEPPPEIREDTGEIEASLVHSLPSLVKVSDIRGDLHIHTSWSDGTNTAAEMIKAAESLNYEYIAITDHSYPSLDFTARAKEIAEVAKTARLKVFLGLEVNITVDGDLQVPDTILENVDFVIAAIHSGFHQEKASITKRFMSTLAHPKVKALAHPTGRILLEREGYEVDWEAIFKECVKREKALEINAYPNRLDLPDLLVRQAVSMRVPLIINTDSHQVSHMDNMRYGVAVARRGWAQPRDILNTLSFQEICAKLNIK